MNSELDSTKYHVLNSSQKRNLILVALLLFFTIIPVLGFFYYKFAVNRPSQTDREVTFEVKKGQGVREIATGLYEEKVLNSEALFVFYVMSNKLDKNIQAGIYKIKAGTSLVELVEIMQHGTNDVKITFLEGWRLEEYAREASQKLENIDYYKFLVFAEGKEGLLFPDTYFVTKDIEEEALIDLLEDAFKKQTESILDSQKLASNNLTKETAFILASLIERESFSEDEKPVIAGILLNRLKEGEMLGIDATTQYAVAEQKFCNYQLVNCPTEEDVLTLNWWPKDINQVDLDVNSPYNTRKNSGLPPTPIASFSLSSLKAVVDPAPTEYLYYLHDADGDIHYAKTLDEHNANVNQYL